MKIAYLCAASILSESEQHQAGSPTHAASVKMLREALASVDGELRPVAWDDPTVDWDDHDVALIGSTWDYTTRHDEFLGTLREIESKIRLENSVQFVGWNANKMYLRELSELDVQVVSTVWLPNPSKAAIKSAFDLTGVDELVIKPQVGASASNQHRLTLESDIPEFTVPMMAQPFISTIQTEGEFSFIFVDGKLTHCVLKTTAPDDYRIQSEHGGKSQLHDPSTADFNAAENVMSVLDVMPLYARVDMVRNPATGALNLMELEVIEPYLFPEHNPDLGSALIKALSKRLAA